MRTLTVVATTGDRFVDFGPYVASVNASGAVAFQAVRSDGHGGVFVGDGGEVADIGLPGSGPHAVSHPDLRDDGAISVYTGPERGDAVAIVDRDGGRVLAGASDGFTEIGPAGPTMNAHGDVAFRGRRLGGQFGVYLVGRQGVEVVAETGASWSAFHGLPLVADDRTVRFRADRPDGTEGIYAWRGRAIETLVETGDRFRAIARFPSCGPGGDTAFAATLRTGAHGIFVTAGADPVQLDERPEAFSSHRGALAWPGGIVRISTPAGGSLGLFAGPDPTADRILAIGDRFAGGTVTDLAANPVSVNVDGQVAIRLRLDTGKQLILRADPSA